MNIVIYRMSEKYEIKVYKIVNDETDEIYVGSTKQSLAKRWGSHKSLYLGHKDGQCKSSILFDRYGIENCSIILIAEYDVENREQQLMKERLHYDALKPFIVNKNRPYVTQEEAKEQEKSDAKLYRE